MAVSSEGGMTRILLSALWKEADSFALGRGSPDSTFLQLLSRGGSNPCFPQQLPTHATKVVSVRSLLLKVGKSAPPGSRVALGGGKCKCGLALPSPLYGFGLLLELRTLNEV